MIQAAIDFAEVDEVTRYDAAHQFRTKGTAHATLDTKEEGRV